MVTALSPRFPSGIRAGTRFRCPNAYQVVNRRPLFNLLRKKSPEHAKPVLTEDNLFHPFSKSPFPAVRARGEVIKSLAPCPVCASTTSADHAQPRAVNFECPDCGWPTHCTEEHWKNDQEHKKYCSKLREVNEDEHDLRSGRRLREYELPGSQDSEAAISFANWDTFWYTRSFPSMDTERSRRHASKLLTYPITIGSILHQYSNITLNNQRLTPEGSRSLAALRTTLHVPPGAPETEEAAANKPQVRVFILGARAESSLPPHAWEQLTMLFPAAELHIFFIGPQVSLPKPKTSAAATDMATSRQAALDTLSATSEASRGEVENTSTAEIVTPSKRVSNLPPKEKQEEKPIYLPNIYEPPTPAPIMRLKRTRESISVYGVPSYTVPYTSALTITGLQTNYTDIHTQFEQTFDPYTDCFFLFSPGFGFPSPSSTVEDGVEPLLQIASPTEWGPVIPQLLSTKCPIFVTGFSPADVERDVRSLATAPGVAGEFDWVITPGPNAFGSLKWEVADFDPRVMVKTNWGIWGIRGKTRDIKEREPWGLKLGL